MLIVVLTASRHESLHRLLVSLSVAEYGDATVDLQINIDMHARLSPSALALADLCLKVATGFEWSQGRKIVSRRLGHAGLSQAWFEVPFQNEGCDFISILEDDMQVSPKFFTIFMLLLDRGAFDSQDVTGFCLHPNDWEVHVPRRCDTHFSRILYESPEPCNWGPIWKYQEWRNFVDWVFTMKVDGNLPYVPDDISYNFNKYLDDGKDVQSSWVWRYNYDSSKKQVRYSCFTCLKWKEVYLAINHKEPGEHFKTKLDLQNDPHLLEFDRNLMSYLLHEKDHLCPIPFDTYVNGAKSMRG